MSMIPTPLTKGVYFDTVNTQPYDNQQFDNRQLDNLTGFFTLLFQVDKRVHPELYQRSNNNPPPAV